MFRRVKSNVLRALVGVALLAVGRGAAADLPIADAFAARGLLVGNNGSGTANSTGATREPSEPRHGGKRGGASVWVSWIPTTNGVVTFSTAGSGFDTLLSAYAYEREMKGGPPGPPDPLKPFDGLKRIVEQDDDYPSPEAASWVKFGVRAGVRYEIAIDGTAGANGLVSLTWQMWPYAQPVPLILSSDTDRSVKAGDTLTLSVDVTSSEEVELEWYFNDEHIEEAKSPVLVIPNFSRAHVGEYKLEVTLKEAKDYEVYSAPVEIQINTEGEMAALARDKPVDALDFLLAGAAAQNGGVARSGVRRQAGVTRGYSGSQIFNTVFARRDPDEPAHCGVVGTASYWFAYQPPADGTAVIDTEGSDFDTVLAVYTFEPPLIGYAGLIPVACDHNSGTNGLTSHLEFAAAKDRTYLVVVDGANNTRGVAHLNYRLVTDVTPPLVAARVLGEAPVLSFPSALGARYRLETAGTLGATNWTTLAVLDGTGDSLAFTNVAPTTAAAFYRVRVE